MQYLNLLALCAVSGAFAQSSETSETTGSSESPASSSDSSTITTTASITTSTVTNSNSSTSTGPITKSIYGLANTANIYEASVLAADQASTTYVASCATGRLLCVNDDFTMTSASSSLQLTNIGVSIGITYTELLTCAISGTTSASCVYSLGVNSGGTSTSTVVTTTESADPLPYATFVVTAGQEKLAAASTIPPSDTGNAAPRATILSSTAHKGLLMAMIGSASAVLAFAVLL